MAMQFNKSYNINRVVKKLVSTILSLYVGGTIISVFGEVMTCTYSPFYKGLSLIGWTVESVTSNGSTFTGDCYTYGGKFLVAGTVQNVITSTVGAGILAVLGILGIASVALEFIK